MTVRFGIREARAKLCELVRRAQAGEEVVITRRGKPDVTLAPHAAETRLLVLPMADSNPLGPDAP